MATKTPSNSSIVTNVYKSRKYLLEQLKERGFDVSNYDNFSINEVHIMFSKDQLDMLFEKPSGEKLYVRYNIAKKITTKIIDTVINDVYGDVLDPNTDELLFIINEEPNDTIMKTINLKYVSEDIFMNVVNMDRLQFNILKHKLVPQHRIMDEDEKEDFLKKYNISDEKTQMPTISRFDPVAIAIGLRPGQVCEITRPSQTSITSLYYRLCV